MNKDKSFPVLQKCYFAHTRIAFVKQFFVLKHINQSYASFKSIFMTKVWILLLPTPLTHFERYEHETALKDHKDSNISHR